MWSQSDPEGVAEALTSTFNVWNFACNTWHSHAKQLLCGVTHQRTPKELTTPSAETPSEHILVPLP